MFTAEKAKALMLTFWQQVISEAGYLAGVISKKRWVGMCFVAAFKITLESLSSSIYQMDYVLHIHKSVLWYSRAQKLLLLAE